MQCVPASSLADCRNGISGYQVAADDLVLGDLSDQLGQDRTVGLGIEAATGCELPHRLVDPPQTHAGDGRA